MASLQTVVRALRPQLSTPGIYEKIEEAVTSTINEFDEFDGWTHMRVNVYQQLQREVGCWFAPVKRALQGNT